ncbi:RND family transporter [Seonamhaeicola sp. ML3]|uniref:efflux RND transporter permease subunit n=1 Tax=Seonamhaeicola sp. ML3 TaxID=2937786 RepID=UPI00200D3949|nr:MMPL family transporter [Seonamhaeicola sp. ML3]
MINYLIKYRLVTLAIVLGLLFLSLKQISSIQINADISHFFPTEDPDYAFYENVNSKLQNDEYLLLLGINNKDSVLSTNFLKNVRDLSDSIAQLSHVKKVTGLHNISYPEKTLFGIMRLPYVDFSDPNDIRFNKIRALKNYEITQNFMTRNLGALFLWVEINDEINEADLEELIAKINTTKEAYHDLEIYSWGRKFIDLTFKEFLEKEIEVLGVWMLVFLVISLLLIFRKPLALVFPVFLILSVLLLFVGGMAFMERPLGTLSNVFPTIILIVGISDVIHMCIRYNLETGVKQEPSKKAIKITLKEIGWTTFVTSLTTALGFFILGISPMRALKSFGIESGFVVLLTYILTIVLLPSFFLMFKNRELFEIRPVYNKLWSYTYDGVMTLIRRPKAVIITYAILLVFAIVGILNINTNSSQYAIPQNSSLYEDYAFFDKHFGGSRTFELILTSTGEERLGEINNLVLLNRVHDYFSNNEYLNSVKSPITYYRAALKAMGTREYSNFETALTDKKLRKIEKQFKATGVNTFLFDTERTIFKFNTQIKDVGRNEINEINNTVLQDVNEIIGDAPIAARISGLDHLLDRSQELSIANMIIGLLIAILMVGFIMGVIFKSLRLTFLALILNVIPLVLSAGILGFTNLELRGEITLMFTVGFVIAVDDTIHFLSKFQVERKKGNGLRSSIENALSESGKAILATSIVLIGGFFILLNSNSIEIFTLGLIVGLMCLITLTVDLVLAPVLILSWFKKHL